MKELLKIVGAAVALIVLAVLGATAFFDGMPVWKVAAMFVLFIVVVYSTQFLNLHMFERTLDARFGRPAPMENVEADYRVLTPRAPVAQLPARTINIPRQTANGTARPWGMQAQPRPTPIIETVDDAGEHLSVPLNFLMRFLALPTPSRSEWSGKRELYSQCLELCNAQGLLDRQANGGSKWKTEYPLTSRKQWALQFEQDDQPIDAEYTDTHAREE